MTQEITVVPVDARRSDWYRLVATVLNRLQNTTAAAGVSAAWGSITGVLSDQSDLQTSLNGKQATLVSTVNIKSVNGSSLLGTGNLAVGTVTSVAASVPTGFSIAGSPITGSGTLAISFAAGYSLPTDASQTNWNTAFGWGNHASAGYLTTSVAASTYQPLDGDLTSLAGASGTNTIYYRSAANTWSAVTIGSNLTFSGGTLSASGGGSGSPGGSSGQIQYNNAGAFGGFTMGGDATVNTGTGALTIANDAVTYAKMQNVSATSRILGRKTASAGDTEECTLSEVLDFIGSPAQGDILYRGSSSWARLGAGTSGQFLKTQGAAANPTWASPVSPFWSSPPAPPTAASFTLTTGTSVTASLTDTTRGTYLSNAGTNAERVALMERSPPGSTWVMTALISDLISWRNYIGYGLFAKDNTGKIHIPGCIQHDSGNGNLKRRDMRLTNINTFSSQITGLDYIAGTRPLWFRLTLNSTNFVAENSVDGEVWTNPYTVSKTAFLGSTISTVGIFMNANVQSTSQTEYLHLMSFTLV